MSNMSFRVLLSTNAANVGIDNNQIHMGIGLDFPRDLNTFFQERGTGDLGRKEFRLSLQCI